MLGAAEDIAWNHGWSAISRTASPGFLAKIGDDMLRLLDELGDGPPTSQKLQKPLKATPSSSSSSATTSGWKPTRRVGA